MPTAPESPSEPRGALGRFLALELLDNRYPQLHGLRVLAILSVVQFHVTWIFAGEQGIALDGDFIASSLTIFFGMDLFFILSGFLIGSILLRTIESAGRQQIRRFYLRRISRTFPSYYIALTFIAVTTAMTASQWRHLWIEYAYGTNFLPLGRTDALMFWGWSLSLEEQFYLTVPLLFFILQRLRSDRARMAVLLLLWASCLFARIFIYARHRPWTDLALYEALYFRPLTRFDTLVCGIILAFVHQRFKVQLGKWLQHPFHRALLAMPSLACLWLLMRPFMFGRENVQLVHIFCWGSVTSIMYFGWLLLLLHAEPGWIHRALSRPVFRRWATLGYGVYLVHIPLCDHAIVPLARRLQRHISMAIVWPFSVLLLMATSMGLAYVMHVLIEKPSLRVRERVAG